MMTSRKITMVDARKVLRYVSLKKSKREIAKLIGVSRTAVSNVIKKAGKCGLSIHSLMLLNDEELNAIIYPVSDNTDPRYSRLITKLPDILTALGEKHETLQFQWEQYIIDDPAGYSYSQFCYYVLQTQKADIDTCAVFNYKYGDLMFIDYAGDTVSYQGLDGNKVLVKVFVAILPASQYIYAGLSLAETTEEWVEKSTLALEYFDGIPAAIIPDCSTSVVKKANKFESELTHQYEKFAEHYQTTVIPARPYSPRDKALVENVINNIYRYIYPRLRARKSMSFEELQENFSQLLEDFNNRTMRRYQKSRSELFHENEKAVLKKLPANRYIFHKYQPPRTVGMTSHVYLKEDKHYYSIPYKYAYKKSEIYYTLTSVKIFCENERICIHPREKGIGFYTTDFNHLSPKLRRFFEWEPRKAQLKALEYGPAVGKVIDTIFSEQAHHLQARKSVYGIFDLAEKYKSERFEAACKMAVREGIARYSVIKNILEKGLDKQERLQLDFEYQDEIHKNLRYFQEEKND